MDAVTPRERVEIRSTIARAWKICYGDPVKYLGMSAAAGAAPFAVMLLNMARDPKATFSAEQGMVGLASLALFAVSFVMGIYYAGAICVLTAYDLDERPLGWTEAFVWIRDRGLFWAAFLVLVLAGLAVLAGLILLVVPAFIFGTWFMLCIPARVLGDRPGREALRHSRELTRPVFRGALALALAVILPILIPNAVAQGICAGVYGFTASAPGRILPPAIIQYLLFIFWGPVAGVAINLFYIDRVGGLSALRRDIFL